MLIRKSLQYLLTGNKLHLREDDFKNIAELFKHNNCNFAAEINDNLSFRYLFNPRLII